MPKRQTSQKSIMVYGIHPVNAILQSKSRQISKIITTNLVLKKLKIAPNQVQDIQIIERSKIDKLNLLPPETRHQGVIAFASQAQPKPLSVCQDSKLVTILDKITDAHNIGSIARNAVAFNVECLIYPKNHSPNIINHHAIHKTSAGNIELLNIIEVTNVSQAITVLKKYGFWIIGLDVHGKHSLCQFCTQHMPSIPKACIILGSEDKGLSELTKKLCDFLVKIDISEMANSLNVSSASALSFFEISRVIGK